MQNNVIDLADRAPAERIDWNRLWKRRFAHWRRVNNGRDCADQWQGREKALAYWKMVRQTQGERIEKTLRDLPLTPHARLLDIGAGPGVLSIPMARRVAHVTAVDASPAMIDVLQENAAARGLDNIAGVSKRWEDISIEADLFAPYDGVVASLSMAMHDIDRAIDKMERVCRGFIHIYWFAGEPAWEAHHRVFEDLLPQTARHRIPLPKSELLLNVLRQKGLDPDVEAFEYMHIDRFGTMAEAMDYFVKRYHIPAHCRNGTLRDRVGGLLERSGNTLVLHSAATCLKICWPSRQAASDATLRH